ncbi:MAG: MBL fold metallo-hydrolase, partial [Hyphomicrobiaceae bacterium]
MSAHLLGNLRPVVNRVVLGSLEVTTILDGAQVRDSLSPPFGVDQTPETIAAHAAANRLPADKFENSFTPTIVNTGKELVLFDTGNGDLRRNAGAGFLRERLGEAGYKPEDIDIVAFTHVHPDHIGGVLEAGAPAFPNARYIIGQVEFDEWKRGDKVPEQRKENRQMFLELIVPLAEKTTYLNPGDDVASGIRAVGAFGHSLGHMAYALDGGGVSALIWGDVTNHYAMSLQRPNWRVGFDDDKDLA